ncbi:hypothetical protein PM082_019000 [Marasmius tenuissimus]|nr:hypothetical protein PM082_019000 [Marasmius tenuissimus]
MPHSSPIASPNTISESYKSSQSNPSSYQYGFSDLAKENLTHVTSYLDPQSLLALGGVNRILNEHVKDDHTWRRAFLLNFLGVKPEADLDESTGLLLRRSESSWAREYVLRCSLRRRWESLRNSTIAYAPVHSQVSDIHLLRNSNSNAPSNTMNTSLLSSSLQYGIVSRSVVFAGKLLKGFLSPSASGTGLGIGNPNTEFAPDVSACTMTSDGGTAKIYWGMRNGEVAFSTSARTMDKNTRSAAKIVRCSVLDQHEGEVLELAYTNEEDGYVASAAKDGRVKVWDVKSARCVWASEYFVPDYPKAVKIATSKVQQGEYVLAAGMQSGDVVIWTNLRLDSTEPRGTATKIKVPCPVQKDSDANQALLDPTITALHLDTHTDSQSVRIIVSYDGQSEFYRIDVPVTTTPSVSIATFKDTNTFIGTITSIYPCLSPGRTDEPSFIIAGTSMGWVCVYTYPPSSPTPNSTVIEPVKKFEAHADGSSITALYWTNTTLITGSSTGSTSVFDAYTFERLRVFGTPVTRPRGGHAPEMQSVRKIVVSGEKDVMVVAVGDRVMGFKADVVKRDKIVNLGRKTKVKVGSHAAVNSKGYNQYALKQLINESVHEHEKEAEHMKKVYDRERQQRDDLEKLGLDEVEAVEYVLMLSRDEALQREREEQQEREVQALLEEGVFEGDFDFGERVGAGPSRSVPTPPSSESSSSNEGSSPPPSVSMNTPPQRPSKPTYSPYTPPRGSQSSNQKIQISPRSREEPWEAGWGGDPAARSSNLSGGGGGIAVSKSWGSVASSISDMELTGRDGDGFPSMASTSPKISKSTSLGEGSSRKGAWGGGSPALKAVAGPSPAKQTATQVSSSSSGGQWRVGEDEDEDLKLAIQLSLEEARMRGEVV